MDIMRPPLDQQVAPAPWLAARTAVDVPSLIRKAMAIQPDAGAEEIVRQLAAWGVQVSGIIVSMWMLKLKERNEQAMPHELSRMVAGKAEEADLFCLCDQEPCTCGNQPARWWQQYCCSTRVTKHQMEERDNFFNQATT